MQHTAPYAVAVTTKIGEYVLSKLHCTEAFIDSTYKTNRSKLELLTVVDSAFGVCFPVAYLLHKQATDDSRRGDSIR